MNNAKDINRYKTALEDARAKEIDYSQVPSFITDPTFSARKCDECDLCGGKRGRRRPLAARRFDGSLLTMCRVCALEELIIAGEIDAPLEAVARFPMYVTEIHCKQTTKS